MLFKKVWFIKIIQMHIIYKHKTNDDYPEFAGLILTTDK